MSSISSGTISPFMSLSYNLNNHCSFSSAKLTFLALTSHDGGYTCAIHSHGKYPQDLIRTHSPVTERILENLKNIFQKTIRVVPSGKPSSNYHQN